MKYQVGHLVMLTNYEGKTEPANDEDLANDLFKRINEVGKVIRIDPEDETDWPYLVKFEDNREYWFAEGELGFAEMENV